MGKLVYATIAPDGQIAGASGFQKAKQLAHAMTGPMVVAEQVTERERNPSGVTKTATLARKRAGLRRVSWKQVAKCSKEEAFHRIVPFFHQMRWTEFERVWSGRMVKGQSKYGKLTKEMVKTGNLIHHTGLDTRAYQRATPFCNSMLGQNYKLEKRIEGMDKVVVMGLSLLPHRLVHDIAGLTDFEEFRGAIKELPNVRGFSLCAGSTPMCREACLVYSGHNYIVLRNAKIKAAKTLAFLHDPVAFGRALYESCMKVARSKAAFHCIRLNVLQDIPWEIIYPWLFERVPVQFYDYTKIPKRKTPANYDLTFSFSGKNEIWCKREMKTRRRRVACVFVAMREAPRSKKADESNDGWVSIASKAHAPLPPQYWGYPVIDGDESDLRPFDPGRVIVGLRYKTPYGRGIDPADNAFSFVTPTYKVEDEIVFDRPGRQRNPATAKVQYLVAPPTPRAGGFRYDPVSGPDEEGEADLFDELEEYGDVAVDPAGELGL